MAEERFAFGKNWQRYSKRVGPIEIAAARQSIARAIDGVDTARASFLDIGSGSGLFSRAAIESGFSRVTAFDYDPDSVAATQAMLESADSKACAWRVMQGSVLDLDFMKEIGQHDVVYSWGVLHHTGAMWDAIDQAALAVRPGGTLFIALYNDQGWISRYWSIVKRLYLRSPRMIRFLMLIVFWVYFGVGLFLADVVRLRNPLRRHSGDARGMKFFTDVIDWVGGYPFEVAAPQAVAVRLGQFGFDLKWQGLVGRRHGCNEFVFRASRSTRA